MLKLKNVSKFYYSKGVIASGFTKVSVNFKLGEFVAIVGESGSGKSTLLNVISGLDSYEEGEMYINGEETSHYRENDIDEYRKKYVSNIFQNFNLVNSYTVYQNIELVLLLNGYRKSEINDKILDLIKKVGLSRYKNTKVSKLSGGQKQRVAIARALARETPIIVCDEPTGNLDSKSSKEVIKLLKEISHEKLVIVVTHNFSEIEDVATRVIKMHDGKIVSDKKLDSEKLEIEKNDNKKIDVFKEENGLIHGVKNTKLFNIFRLGLRNTFNIIPKFILMFIVFLFITTSLLTVYGSLRKSEYESEKLGYNYYFSDTSDTRIIIKKSDGSFISSDEFDKIEKLNNVDYVIENDIMLDEYLWFDSLDNNGYYISGMLRDIDSFTGELDYGRMPESDNEVVVLVNEYDWVFSENLEDALKVNYYYNGNDKGISVKVVGVKYIDEGMFGSYSNIIYGTDNFLDKYMMLINLNYSNILLDINNKKYNSYNQMGDTFTIVGSDRVSSGNAIVSDGINYTCKDFDCKNKLINISIDNLYYSDSLELSVSHVYNSKNVMGILGIDKDNSNYGSIFINSSDYNELFNKDSYQASVFAKRVDYVDDIDKELSKLGFDTMQMRKSLNNEGETVAKVLKIVKLVVTLGLVITLFFISYFVIKLILKSRNVYFSTLRILGAPFSHIKRILDVELFVNSSLAYFSYILFVLLLKNDIIEINFIKSAMDYLNISDYILMYIILIIMSYLISSRFASKLFKSSAMKSYREEV